MKSSETETKTLLVGIGNYGRSDDAIGWKFIDYFSMYPDQFDIAYRYQLQIEDAELINRYENVIFIDACRTSLENGFDFYPCRPEPGYTFTTHRLSPGAVFWLAKELYGAETNCHVLAIEGKEWGLDHGLSETGERNFDKALSFFSECSV